MKYVALISISFEVEFEDDGDLVIEDQAHEAGMDILPREISENLLDFDVRTIVEKR